MNGSIRTALLASAIAVIFGCSLLPDRVDTVEQARSDVRRLEQDRLASEAAATDLASARKAIEQADDSYARRQPLGLIEHKAYVAQRYADISKQRIAQAHAKEQIAAGESDRDRVLVEARTREVEAQLSDLQAKQTVRGLVLTLGDVLFDSAQSTLKPGAETTIDRLAQFMRDYPDRQVMIEGHTDSRGSDDFNRDLSERRADAVRDALMDRNVDAQRVRSVGLGESYPVARNDSPGGMQQNRRVEILISDEQGAFPNGSQRTAAVTR